MMYARSMNDFATSRWSSIEKSTIEAAREFCKTSEEFQLGRFDYFIQVLLDGHWVPVPEEVQPKEECDD
jgi:hypothetical protein